MEYISVLLPSAAVGTIFYFTMRAIVGADRAERAAQAAAENEMTQSAPTQATRGQLAAKN
ncbi:hypothetical protein [Arthrobacter sp. 35/47]|uniref:hypothetical protein n=1 Tax=Arthrobacter sp. 35/47 TaxID=269454 RepID=UPI00055EB040|nr:hypothetical protein [Arthrobacter sp. 35/47]